MTLDKLFMYLYNLQKAIRVPVKALKNGSRVSAVQKKFCRLEKIYVTDRIYVQQQKCIWHVTFPNTR